MDPCEWTYVAEGGKHAVFQYKGLRQDDEAQRQWEGKVLRINKTHLKPLGNGRVDYGAHVTSEAWIRTVLAPALTPYLDVPEPVCLTLDFVQKLRNQTLASGMIPECRRRTWERGLENGNSAQDDQHDDLRKLRDGSLIVRATVHVNYRKPAWLFQTIPNCSVQRMSEPDCWLSVEIKPKAGYKACSPLVHPLSRFKYRYTRFYILQQLHHDGCVEKGWNRSELTKRSRYCPLDLFSDKDTRIHHALDCLWECPQNNLKMWYDKDQNNEHCVLVDETNKHDDSSNENTSRNFHDALQTVFQVGDTTIENAKSDFSSAWKQVMTCILKAESRLLSRLLKLQMLDLIDGDGAVYIYNHLFEKMRRCNDSESLEDVLGASFDINKYPGMESLVSESLFEDIASLEALGSPCENLRRFVDLVDSFSKTISASDNKALEEISLDRARSEAMSLVQQFSKEECIYLLRNWLLSLSMCDVSFFVTLHPVGETRSQYKPNWEAISQHEESAIREDCPSEGAGNPFPSCRIVRTQSEDSTGLVCITSHDNGNESDVWIEYTIKLVDVDMKPASKLRSRASSENVIQNFHPDGE